MFFFLRNLIKPFLKCIKVPSIKTKRVMTKIMLVTYFFLQNHSQLPPQLKFLVLEKKIAYLQNKPKNFRFYIFGNFCFLFVFYILKIEQDMVVKSLQAFQKYIMSENLI